MYLTRAAEQPLKDMLGADKVGVVLGARQVGKTTLVEHVSAGQPAVFLNFDVEVDKARFQAAAALSPSDGRRSLGNPSALVIDEAQRLPDTPVSSRPGMMRGCRRSFSCSAPRR